jgi:hypothetical protein
VSLAVLKVNEKFFLEALAEVGTHFLVASQVQTWVDLRKQPLPLAKQQWEIAS